MKNNDFCRFWEARIALGGSGVGLGSSWNGLEPLLGALGPLLRDLGSLLGDLESVLGDLDSLLGALGSLLGGLGDPRGPWPGSQCGQGQTILPPPVGNSHSGPPPSRQFHYFLRPREEENETMELKNRRSKIESTG